MLCVVLAHRQDLRQHCVMHSNNHDNIIITVLFKSVIDFSDNLFQTFIKKGKIMLIFKIARY